MPFNRRAAAGGGFLSGTVDKLLVGRRLRELTPKQLGDEDTIDTDVRDEMDRVAIGGADEDVVKVWASNSGRGGITFLYDLVAAFYLSASLSRLMAQR